MTGYAQPDALPLMKLTMGEVQVIEQPTAIGPSNIITDGGQFWLRTEISTEGILAFFLGLVTLEVTHHFENIEGGLGPVALPPVAVPPFPAQPGSVTVVAGPFVAGAGNPVDLGTWRVLTHVHCTAPAAAMSVVGGFTEGPVIEVLPAP